MDLDELERLADGATPGPWQRADGRRRPGAELYVVDDGTFGEFVRCVSTADAAYLAALDPDTVRALVAAARERDALRAMNEHLGTTNLLLLGRVQDVSKERDALRLLVESETERGDELAAEVERLRNLLAVTARAPARPSD